MESDLTTKEQVGIGVGIGVGTVSLVGILGFFYYEKARIEHEEKARIEHEEKARIEHEKQVSKEERRIAHEKEVDAKVAAARAKRRQEGVNASLFGNLPDAVKQFVLGPMLLNLKNINTFNSHIAKGLRRYSFIIGLSNKTYDGYRKITCDEWNNIDFREYFIDYYKKNNGIENKMTEEPVSNMLIFGRSKPIVNDCQIEVADVKEQPNCKLSYCERERHGLRHFDLSTITPELLGKSTCFDPMRNDYAQIQFTSIIHVNMFSPNAILPCLFVSGGSKTGSSRKSRRRSQKKRTRKN